MASSGVHFGASSLKWNNTRRTPCDDRKRSGNTARALRARLRAARRYGEIDRPSATLVVARDDSKLAYREFSSLPSRIEGVEMKFSSRCSNAILAMRVKLPHIDKVGKFTGCHLASVKISRACYVMTVVATILNRLNYRNRFYNKRRHRANPRLLAGIAFYYAVSKNTWFFDRILSMLKDFQHNEKAIKGLLAKFMSRTDDYTRFVYSQVCFQTHWLLFRGLRPRDKSAFIWKGVRPDERAHQFSPLLFEGTAYRIVSKRVSSIQGTNWMELPT